jgi:hypothetical protein
MWAPRRLTTVWASTACYKEAFFNLAVYELIERDLHGLQTDGKYSHVMNNSKLELITDQAITIGMK